MWQRIKGVSQSQRSPLICYLANILNKRLLRAINHKNKDESTSTSREAIIASQSSCQVQGASLKGNTLLQLGSFKFKFTSFDL
jgi:hypothetical protein